MYAERHTIALTTDAAGDATGYSPNVTGRILGIRVVVPGSGGIASTSDITITAEATGESILALTNQNGSGTFYPRAATCSTAGAAALYAAGGTAINDYITLANDRVKVVIAQGGNTLSCTIHIIIG